MAVATQPGDPPPHTVRPKERYVSEMAERAAVLGLRILLDALQQHTGSTAAAGAPQRVPETDAWLARGTIGDTSLTAALVFIVSPDGEGPWYEAKAALERRIGGALAGGGYVLWAPSGAELAVREPRRSELIVRVQETAARFVPGGRGEVRFPVGLYLRKSDEEGSYLTARGGLASVWARFTGRVFGHYQLDSTELNRVPAGEGYLSTLVDRVALEANALKLGQTIEIEADDAWTMQRLTGGEGLTIVGEPPGAELSSGAPLRRNLRRTIAALRPPLIAEPAGARVVCFVGPYRSFADQPVGTALLGMDPTLYGGMDLILLAADGQIGPLLDLTHSPLLAARQNGPGESTGWGVQT